MAQLSENELLLLSHLGFNLYKEGQYDKAIIFFEGLSEMHPERPELHSVLSLLYYLTGKPEEALTEGVEALKRKQNDVSLQMTLGEIYLALNQPDNALEMLNRAYSQALATNHPAAPRILLLLQSNR
jgi:tetratricopeptide (TPR) repeat protein